ncbi:glycosyltransferase family 2 protein [Leifsonia naganoensis]|uniref:Glycosyltransferase involved in cell wall biosynthesis n=1 Tax=Leifsonia naganoensis TaxID=150025 RepID=A0A853DTI1_9MICO|nr:glycosyltransferase family 2 protein [Leifsonia naganoensis]NYK08935.1 glycosyltransferase involved in cell wall biosynthesis [Leifsonia naganoensis]
MPDVTVVIPTRNKEAYLALTLAGFAQQTYGDFELIIVDDGGSVDLDPAIAPLHGLVDFHLIRQANAGRGAARNTGAYAGSGRLLVFCDDDRIPGGDFVEAHVRAASDSTQITIGQKRQALTRWIPNSLSVPASLLAATAVDGSLDCVADLVTPEDILGLGVEEALRRYLLPSHRDNFDAVRAAHGDAFAGYRLPWLAMTTANVAIGRAVFEGVDGFEGSYEGWGAEDTDLGYRLWRAGCTFQYVEDAINYHQVHPIGSSGDYDLDLILRQRELQRNARQMARKYDTLETFVFQGMCESRYSPAEASAIVQDIEDGRLSDRVMREIVSLYRKAA